MSLHCSLDENTYHLLNEDRLNMMKKDAVLVNCARGPVIDEVALTNFLQANENFRWEQAAFLLYFNPVSNLREWAAYFILLISA